MNKLIIFLGCLCTGFLSSAPLYATQGCFQVFVNDNSNQETVRVEIMVKNNTSKNINLSAAELPWYFSTSPFFWKLIKGSRPNSLLQGRYRLSNPVGKVTLPPQQTLTKQIDLTRQFISLSEILSKEEVILFWSYKPKNKLCQRQCGWLLLKQHSAL